MPVMEENPMKKNFIEVGETYTSQNGLKWECIGIRGYRAWLVLNGNHNLSAHAFRLDGTPVSHEGVKEYQLLPSKPNIDKNDANLRQSDVGDCRIFFYHHDEGINGRLYTHPKAGVALFVRENIDGETLAEAIGELQWEIGG